MYLYIRYLTVKLSKFGVDIFESTYVFVSDCFESTYSFVVASLFATGLPKLTIRLLFTKNIC